MLNWLPLLTLLAQDAAPAGGDAPQGSFWSMVLLFGPPVLLMIVLQSLFGNNSAKEKAKQEELISNLKKNDPVVTIGGIYGTYVSTSADKSEITIKVDDNTRLKMQASAIRAVPPKEPEAETAS